MFLIQNTIGTVASIFHAFISVYIFIVLASSILSWFNIDSSNKFIIILKNLTEPALSFIRSKFPFTSVGGMDFSPLLLLTGLWLVDGIIIQSLLDIAYKK